jgi:hypothetical protein
MHTTPPPRPLVCSPLEPVVESMHPCTFGAYRSLLNDASPCHCIAEPVVSQYVCACFELQPSMPFQLLLCRNIHPSSSRQGKLTPSEVYACCQTEARLNCEGIIHTSLHYAMLVVLLASLPANATASPNLQGKHKMTTETEP